MIIVTSYFNWDSFCNLVPNGEIVFRYILRKTISIVPKYVYRTNFHIFKNPFLGSMDSYQFQVGEGAGVSFEFIPCADRIFFGLNNNRKISKELMHRPVQLTYLHCMIDSLVWLPSITAMNF